MRRLLCALLALLLLLGGAAAEAEGLLWLHGDFETVETDGYTCKTASTNTRRSPTGETSPSTP